MGTENRPAAADSLDQLASRVKALEDNEHGWMAIVGRIGIVIGCVGGLIGGVSTLRQLWEQVNAQPYFEVVAERFLTVSWDPQQRSISIKRNIALQNTGAKIGSIPNPPAARLESTSLANTEVLSDIKAMDSYKDVLFPMSIRASDAKNLTLVMSSTFSQATEPAFPKEGAYKLWFSLETPTTPEPDTYCFQLNKQLVDQLRNTGEVRIVVPDPCGK